MMAQPDLMKQALASVYNWASKKGYGPTYKPDKDNPKFVSAMKGEILLKVIIEDGKINVITAPKTPELENEVIDLLGLDKDFEDEPLDLSGKDVEIVDAKQIDPAKEVKPAVVEKKPNAPAKRATNTPARKQAKSEAKEKWDEYAAGKDETYRVSGRDEFSAFGVSKLMNAAGLCSKVMQSGVDENAAWAVVRAIDPATGHFREDVKTLYKTTFLAMKAMDIAVSQEKKRAGFIKSFDVDGKPVINPERTVGGTPAPIWLAQQLIRAWNSADGVAATGAERRAALKMMNREWRDEDEIAMEKAEADAIQEMK